MKTKYFVPLILFIIPTAIFSIILWPPEAAQPGPIGGFTIMLVSVVMTYISGLRSVLNDTRQAGLDAKK